MYKNKNKMYSSFNKSELEILIKDQKKIIKNIKKEEQDYYDRTTGNGQHYLSILDEEYIKLRELEEQLKKLL